jgi:hypothetical protein
MRKAYSYCMRVAQDAPPLFDIVVCEGRTSAFAHAHALLDSVSAARSVEVADGEGWRLVCVRPANDDAPWPDGLWA